MERTIPARNSNETPRIPVGAHSNELSRARPRVTSASSKARGDTDDVANVGVSLASQRDVRQDRVIARGVLIKSKRPIRRRDKGAGLVDRWIRPLRSEHRSGPRWDRDKTRLKNPRWRYGCHAPRSFSLVTMSDRAWANSIRWMIWLTSHARNIRLWYRRYIPVLRLMVTQRRISICFAVRLNAMLKGIVGTFAWTFGAFVSSRSKARSFEIAVTNVLI